MISVQRFEFAKVYNKNINKYYINIYFKDGKPVLRDFLKALKSIQPGKKRYEMDAEQRNKDFRYTVDTSQGKMQFCTVEDRQMIDSWDNQPLIEKVIELLSVDPNFHKIEAKPMKEIEPVEEEPKPCGYSFSAVNDRAHIYIDIDSPFSQSTFLEALGKVPGIEVKGKENIFSSWGPLESSDEVCTNLGNIMVSSVWEGMDVGYTISGETKLMELVIEQMDKSKYFFRE